MDERILRDAKEFQDWLARFLEVGLSRNVVFGRQTGFE